MVRVARNLSWTWSAPPASDLGVDLKDLPAVAVLDPVRGRRAEPAVVGAADDELTHTGPVPIAQRGLGHRSWCNLGRFCDFSLAGEPVQTFGAGALIELGDEVARGGEHDRVLTGGAVGAPGLEEVVGHRGEVADVNAVVVEVETERGRVALTQCE